MAFAIKAHILDATAESFSFADCKTMYGGKRIGAGDVVYIFASETEGGAGLIARGEVVTASALARHADRDRQTPRLALTLRPTGSALRRLGRVELKTWRDWSDGRPETELNFKLYRQATNKLVGLSAGAADFLATYF